MEFTVLFLVFPLLLLWVTECSASLCYVYSTYKWCDHGCCGNTCCSGLEAWIIVLIVFGIIAAIVIIIVVICVVKNKGQSGRVVHPQPHVTVIGTSQGGAYGPPPAYNTTVHPPPGPASYNYGNTAYSNPAYSNPAYPPGYSGGPAAPNDPFAAAAGSK